MNIPPWFEAALRELGTTEIPGDRDNPKVVAWHRACGLPGAHDELAWCSVFANAMVRSAGLVPTGRANARSWLKWGVPLPLDAPRFGCIVVFSRDPNPAEGHVGFYVGEDADEIWVLGGNQGNRVTIAVYPKSRLLGYRWPSGTVAS